MSNVQQLRSSRLREDYRDCERYGHSETSGFGLVDTHGEAKLTGKEGKTRDYKGKYADLMKSVSKSMLLMNRHRDCLFTLRMKNAILLDRLTMILDYDDDDDDDVVVVDEEEEEDGQEGQEEGKENRGEPDLSTSRVTP